jgi:pyruvate formate lyase activating enzyme
MLHIGGFTPLSSTDWPGMLSAVVFCQGCSWRCRYCHNPELIPPQGEHEIPWRAILDFLQRRQGLLDAVVFSGGEPTLQANLPDAMREARELGFRIGLHTAGIYPKQLKEILPLVDWVGLDIKAPFADYARITGVQGSGDRARACLDLVLQSGVEHEIRTTVHPALLPDEDMKAITRDLADRGARQHVLQPFRSQGCQDLELTHNSSTASPLFNLTNDRIFLKMAGDRI